MIQHVENVGWQRYSTCSKTSNTFLFLLSNKICLSGPELTKYFSKYLIRLLHCLTRLFWQAADI